ncbi:hypothetical protein J9303_19640, partial [Bacillaceae bacterium Marseille-Q3522]|nr:hypothetical protein [Bacillaceae bacterium Marseille-Q3522]
ELRKFPYFFFKSSTIFSTKYLLYYGHLEIAFYIMRVKQQKGLENAGSTRKSFRFQAYDRCGC